MILLQQPNTDVNREVNVQKSTLSKTSLPRLGFKLKSSENRHSYLEP